MVFVSILSPDGFLSSKVTEFVRYFHAFGVSFFALVSEISSRVSSIVFSTGIPGDFIADLRASSKVLKVFALKVDPVRMSFTLYWCSLALGKKYFIEADYILID